MFLKLSKLFSLLLIVNVLWYSAAYDTVPYVLQILTVCTLGSLVIHLATRHVIVNKNFPKELVWWLVFGVYALATGIFVAKDRIYLISSLGTYFSFLLVCIGMFYISREEKNIKWILKILVITAILCAFNTIFFGYDYNNGVHVVTMGPNNNPNTLGITMCFGIFALLYMIDLKNSVNAILGLAMVCVFVYVIILSGSRKSFLGCVILGGCWLLFAQREKMKDISLTRKIVFNTFIIAVIVLAYGYFSTQFLETASFQRLESLFTNSDEIRKNLYKEAWSFFMKSPIVGIGYNQFCLNSWYGFYSHSTYAEVLSCTGVYGTVLYFVPYIMSAYKLLKKLRTPNITVEIKYNTKMWISLLLMMLFLGVGVIHFYKIDSMIIMVTMFIFTGKNFVEDSQKNLTAVNKQSIVISSERNGVHFVN
jgi:hypothetical protein